MTTTFANVFDKLPATILWIFVIGSVVAVCNYWLRFKTYLQRSWSIEKTVILKSRGSALNDHVATYVSCKNMRRLWPEISLNLLTSFFTSGPGKPVIREIGLMNGTLRVRDFSSLENALPTSRLIVVAFVEPSPYVTLRELFVCKICDKLANVTFFSIHIRNNCRKNYFSVQQIRSAVVYLTNKYPKSYFTAVAYGRNADSLLNYLGDTGAACRFESATLLAPACKFGQRKRSSVASNVVVVDRTVRKAPRGVRKFSSGGVACSSTASTSAKRLRKISLQEVASINFDNFFVDLSSSNGVCELPSTATTDSRTVTPKNSTGNALSAFLPDNVDDVAIPVLWVPEQRDEGCIAPVELFEESINFMLLKLGSGKRCRLDLWQTAVQFGLAVHSFFHPDVIASDKLGVVRRK